MNQLADFLTLLRQSSAARWGFVFLILPLFAGTAISLWAIHQEDFLRKADFPVLVLLFLLLSIAIATSLIPNTIAGLLAGYFWSWWGLAGMIFAFVSASCLGFMIGRRLDHGFKEIVVKIWPGVRPILDGLQKQSFWTVMLLRLSPVPPFAIGTLLLSWINIPFRAFLGGSLLGMFPRMAMVVGIGASSKEIMQLVQHPGQNMALAHSTWVFLAIAMAGFWWLKKKMKSH